MNSWRRRGRTGGSADQRHLGETASDDRQGHVDGGHTDDPVREQAAEPGRDRGTSQGTPDAPEDQRQWAPADKGEGLVILDDRGFEDLVRPVREARLRPPPPGG